MRATAIVGFFLLLGFAVFITLRLLILEHGPRWLDPERHILPVGYTLGCLVFGYAVHRALNNRRR